MKADYLSYQRATSVSLLGLGLQLALGLFLLIYALYGRDHAAMTAALFVFLGLPVWLSLAIVFDQHRRERIEAAEAETFAASDAASSSAFDGAGEDLRVAAKRLKVMHRLFLPAVSLGMGAALVAVGILRFNSGEDRLSPDSFVEPRLRYWALAVGLSVAVIGFIFARFVSGMAKQKMWANLRAGAAYAVGSALLGLAIAVGHFIDIAGPDIVLRYLQVAFPVVMVVLGAEVFLNFVLDVYRPRKAGEMPRPAFDSRVLGFAAAPDRIAESISDAINYQFGFDVTSSWFYQLLSRSVVMLLVLGLVVIWGMSCFTVIQPHQRGIVTRFGTFVKEVGPGLHVKMPWPIERVDVPLYTRTTGKRGEEVTTTSRTSTGVRTLHLATRPPANEGPILWTNEHATEEIYMLVQPASLAGGGDGVARENGESNGAAGNGTGATPGSGGRGVRGRNLSVVSAEIPLHYAVRDVVAYEMLGPPEMRDELLKAVAQRAVMHHMATMSVDQVLGAGRLELSAGIRERVEAAFAALNPDATGKPRGAGVEVLFLAVEGVHPPGQVARPYEAVVDAEQRRQANIKAARADAIRTLTAAVGSVELAERVIAEMTVYEGLKARRASAPEITAQELALRELLASAGGEAGTMVLQAQSARWARHMGQRGRAARYQGQLVSYQASPMVYQAGQYFDALKRAMADARVYITSDAIPQLLIRADLTESATRVDIFDPKNEDGEDITE